MKGTVVKEDETFVEKYHCSLLNFTIEQTGLINYLILFTLFLSALIFTHQYQLKSIAMVCTGVILIIVAQKTMKCCKYISPNTHHDS